VSNAITGKTKAIVPVHLFGLAADMDPILEIAAARKLCVIEDAAQAIGAKYKDKPVGAIGMIGCFSFFPSKNLGGAGDGGLVSTNDPDLAERLRMLHLHGSRSRYKYELLGMNSRLDALQAAILRVKLRYLDEWASRRRANAQRYCELLATYGLIGQIKAPTTPPGYVHVYNQFTIRISQREALRAHLQQSGIPSEIYYPYPLHLQPAFSSLGYAPGSLAQAESASAQVLSLPIFPELTPEQQESVIAAIARFCGK